MQAIAIESLQSLSGRLIGLGLLHSLWISLCAASAVALWFQLRPYLSHQSRHRILVTALLLVAAAPIFVTALASALASPRSGNALTSAVIRVRAGAGELEKARPDGHDNVTSSALSPSPRQIRFRSILSAGLTESVVAVHRLRPFMVVAWGAGVVVCAVALAVGTIAVQRMCREGRPAEARIRQRANQLARRAGLKMPPQVIVHPRACEPFVCGLVTPVILLPEAWLAGCQRDLLDAILAHELAHARRRDHLVNLAQRLVEIALFFSPAVLWLSRSLRRQREFCADALAVRLTGDPAALARALESVARIRLSSPRRPTLGAPLGGQTISLLPRIQELLGMMPARPRPRFWPIAALPAAGIIAMIAATSGLSRGQPAASTRDKGTPINATATAPIVASRPATSDRQISYEVRYMKLLTDPWRELMKDRLKLVQQEADVSVWIIDKKSLASLLNHAQTSAGVVFQAPKVTSFENNNTTICDEYKQQYIAQLDKIKSARGIDFRPIIKEIGIGWRVEVAGSFLPDGTNVSVDVRDSNLVAIHGLTRKEQFGAREIVGTYQVPSMIEHRCRVVYAVPDESSLVVSLGLQVNETPIFAGVTEVAGKLFESIGLSRYEPPRTATCERMVVITPRRIVLESEENRLEIPPAKAVQGAPAS
jgi:beta-lactamase regulating signal transducer with metallopeptidase domain